MPDISLLPENQRGKETEEIRHKPAPDKELAGLKMHVPAVTADEDVEIIEVDESELGIVLASEPWLTRAAFKFAALLDSLKDRLFKAKEAAPPPKLPPQFFTPPKPGLATRFPAPAAARPVTAPGVPTTTAAGIELDKLKPGLPAGRPKALITPQAEAPKRVRVIKRTRKSVRVSLIPAEQLALLTVDVGKRQWTLAVLTVLFLAISVGGYVLLTLRAQDARAALAGLHRDITETRSLTRGRQSDWSAYRDLQPRLALLDQVLKSHVVVSRVFDFLETRTLPDVSYRSAGLSPGGVLTLDVLAASFGAAARQLTAFEKSPLVKRVEATAFTAEQDGTTGAVKQVSFQLLLTLDTAPLRGPVLALADDLKTAGPAATSSPP